MNIKDTPVRCEIIEITGIKYRLCDFNILHGEDELPPWDGGVSGDNEAELQKKVVEVLSQTAGVCDDYADFIRLALAFKAGGYQYEEVDAVFRVSKGYNLEENRKIYDGLKPSQITMKTAYYFAERTNPEALRAAVAEIAPLRRQPQIADQEGQRRERFLCTDMGNGQRLAAKFGENLRHTLHWGWLVWNGQFWERDERGTLPKLAKKTATTIFAEAKLASREVEKMLEKIQRLTATGVDPTSEEFLAEQNKLDALQAEVKGLNAWAIKSQAKQRLDAMIDLAASEGEVSSHQTEFDIDREKINLLNGTFDLRTGTFAAHDRNNKITKCAGVKYDPTAKCSLWLTFLDRIFGGNLAVITFVQRACGYSLTGLTFEHVLFFLYGLGKNGKSTFCGILGKTLKLYAIKTPAETLYLKQFAGGIPNDIARMAGTRVVIASELAEKRLNESLVKDLTGGDIISARFLHHEFFDFEPQFKLWMYGNHKPVITGTDEGIWRRIKLIPFTVQIPENEQDKELSCKLELELSGILNWMITGAAEWYRNGLGVPEEVKQATAEYRSEMDNFGTFLDESCLILPQVRITKTELYDIYKEWCVKNGEQPESQIKVSQKMTMRGFLEERSTKSRFWIGIGKKVVTDFPPMP